MEAKYFLSNLASTSPTAIDRAVALLWFLTYVCEAESVSSNDLCKMIEEGGFGKQNSTRIRKALNRDRKVVKHNKNGYRIHLNHIDGLREKYYRFSGTRPVPKSAPVLPHELFKSDRWNTIWIAVLSCIDGCWKLVYLIKSLGWVYCLIILLIF